MGTGIVFVYLIIAALVAPIVWVLWWSAGSLSRGTQRAVTAPQAPAVLKPVFAYPEAVDLNLPSRAGAVSIYSASGRQVSSCAGPDSHGRCPRPDAEGTVPCSGCVLALPRPIRGSFEWQIPARYKACLLGSYASFRQAG